MDGKKLCLGCMEFYDADIDVCPFCGYAEGTQSTHVLHLTPGTVLHRRYIVGKALGYGSFGVTYIGWDKLMKRKVAIKEYLPSEYATRMLKASEIIVPSAESSQNKYDKGMEKFRREAEKLAKVGNMDGVVYIYDTFEENNTAYIIMEYLHGQTLAAYMQEKGIFSEEETLDLMLPVLQALESIHEKQIIHRDISPDNIFICTDSTGNHKVKLIDFGAAKFASSSHSKSLTVLLRPGYSPEEQYRSGGEQGPYTDVYAVAAVMYQMVTGVCPPDALERRTSIERKKKDLITEPGILNRELSENFETALMNALNVKIEDRTATADAFITELISYEKVKRRGNSIKQIDFFRWPLWAKILVPVSGLAAVALLIGAGIWLNSLLSAREFVMPKNCTRVVNFTGATSIEAEELAHSSGLVAGISNTEYSPAMIGNRILRQDQAAGSIVPVNTLVNMVISTDRMSFAMPDVTGMSIYDARYALECMGIEIQTQEGTLNGLASGGVISQDIEPYSEVVFGQTVLLTVTPEDENPAGAVPQLAGLPYAEALSAAEAGGVRMVVTQRIFSRDYSEATVLEQSITAGSELNAGEAVAVTVVVPWREFAMPNLLYKDREAAIQILKNIGITPEFDEQVSEVVSRGLVFGQSVAKDTTIEPDTPIILTVSSGTTPFEMPLIEGLTAEDAEKTLTEYKLVPLEEKGYDENVAEGSVISQSIASGISVTRGTEVTYVVCSHEGLQKVPDVRNQDVNQAKSALEGVGFVVQVDTDSSYNPAVPKDAVLSQFPNGGTMQAEGSTVTITLSKGPEPVPETTVPPATQGPASFTWSDWGPSAPAGSETRSKTQYRYRVRETTTSGSPTLDGWSLYNTSGAWSDWSGWSDWTTSPISASDSVSVETITQYRYRDMEYTSSTSASLDGWTQIGSSESYTDYGGWSDWWVDPVTASDTRQVETATIWGYYYFQCPGCGTHWHGWDFKCASWGGGGCGTYTQRKQLFSELEIDSFEAARSIKDIPLVLVVIDNFAGLTASKIGEAQSFKLQSYIKDCANYGVKFVIACSHLNEAPSRIRQELGSRICLHMKDKYDYSEILGCKVSYIPPEIPGRGLVNNDGVPLEFQSASILAGTTDKIRTQYIKDVISELCLNFGSKAEAQRLPVFSETATYEDFARQFKRGRIPLGYSKRTGKPIALPLKQFSALSLYFGNILGVRPILENIVYAANREGMDLWIVKREKNSAFECNEQGEPGICGSKNVKLFSLGAQSIDKLRCMLTTEIAERNKLLQEYCASNGMVGEAEELYRKVFGFLRESTAPIMLLVECFADFCVSVDSISALVFDKCFCVAQRRNIYVIGCFEPEDHKRITSRSLYYGFNPEANIILFGGQFEKQDICILPDVGNLKKVLPFNSGLMNYQGLFYPILMPCGELHSEEVDEDEQSIF